MDKILSDIEKSSYKQSIKAIFRQQDKLEKLQRSLINFAKSESDFYGVQAFSRILIEHFLVGHYIWSKTLTNKNDNVGEEYYKHYELSEFFKRENFELKVEGIRINKKNHNTNSNVLSKYPELSEVTEAQLFEVHKTAKQFDLREILDYLINEIPNDKYSKFNNLMLGALSEYNNLSSYIHGGPSAEMEAYENRPVLDKSKRISDCLAIAQTYVRAIKEHILFLLLEDNKEYFEIMKPIFDETKD